MPLLAQGHLAAVGQRADARERDQPPGQQQRHRRGAEDFPPALHSALDLHGTPCDLQIPHTGDRQRPSPRDKARRISYQVSSLRLACLGSARSPREHFGVDQQQQVPDLHPHRGRLEPKPAMAEGCKRSASDSRSIAVSGSVPLLWS